MDAHPPDRCTSLSHSVTEVGGVQVRGAKARALLRCQSKPRTNNSRVAPPTISVHVVCAGTRPPTTACTYDVSGSASSSLTPAAAGSAVQGATSGSCDRRDHAAVNHASALPAQQQMMVVRSFTS